MLKLAILETDILSGDLATRYQGYGVMFQQLFARAGVALESDIFSVISGVYPPNPDAYDALLITGSKADAFSDQPWVVTLREYVRQRYQAGSTLLGICFGHQLLAEALGGKVERSAKGWGVGLHHYHWQAAANGQFALIASHRDQVLRLPAGAEILASSDFCPIAAFRLGTRVMAFQGHPEFTVDYARQLLQRRREDIGTERCQQALASFDGTDDGLLIACTLADFIATAKGAV